MNRRYDVDSIRVIAIILLIIYHILISFQTYASDLFFVESEEKIEWLQIIMSMMNVWRIPILFLVSGMGVRFALERRDWIALVKDRSYRILLPFVFGTVFIGPLAIMIGVWSIGFDVVYFPTPAHLWFLGNIYLYVLVFLPVLMYLKNHSDNGLFVWLKKCLQFRIGVFICIPLFVVSTWVVDPKEFSTFAFSLHGLFYGAVCFLVGFILVSCGDTFWQAVERARHMSLVVAVLLYIARLAIVIVILPGEQFELLTAVESGCAMLAILGFGSKYLNRPWSWLGYGSKAVYPVYIIHFPVQMALAVVIFSTEMPASVMLITLLVSSLISNWVIYELILRRLKWIRPMFGISYK